MGSPGVSGMLGSLAVVAILLGAFATWAPVQAAVLPCPAGDVACLIAAINTANGNGEADTIMLAAGTYLLTAVDNETNGSNGFPSITSPITIQGTGADSTIIAREAGAPPFRLLHVSAEGVLQLEGLTVRGGSAFDPGPEPQLSGFDGGGLLNFGDVRIANSHLTHNEAFGAGGGLANIAGAVTITHTVVARNRAEAGAGFVSRDGTVEITEASFLENATVVELGGGFWNCGGTATIATTTFARNAADGGAVVNGGSICRGNTLPSTMTLVHTTIADSIGTGLVNSGTMLVLSSAIPRNGVSPGGGSNITDGGTLTVINTTIAAHEERALGNDGDGSLTLINSTVADNGGMFSAPALTGPAVLINTIVARNMADPFFGGPDCSGPVTSQGHNLIGDPTGCTITLQPSDLTGHPGLGSLVDDGTPGQAHVPLLAASRAINAGDHDVCGEDPRLATDQLGNPRLGICDIGAIEFQQPVVLINDLVTFDPIRSTFTFSPDPTGCPEGFVGRFSFEARLTNTSDRLLSDVFVAVTTLTRGNLLQNADGGPTGVGARLTVPQQDGFADGVLGAEEFVDVPFIICLTQRRPFRFVVDVLGVLDANSDAHAQATLMR